MNRLVILLALIALGFASRLTAAPPNVVFILADDLGVNDLRCYGRKDHNTPHLDRLAGQGARFTAAYAACPVCSPTRAAIMSGKSPARLHLTTFLPGRPDAPSQRLLHPKINQHLPLAEKTLAEYLKEAGYATGCFGKWHLGGKGYLPTDQGFDVYYPGKANTTPSESEGGKGEFDLTAKAVEFVETHKDRPFFLYLAHNTPHIPYAAKPDLVAKNAKAFEPTYAAVIESMDEAVGLLLKKLDDLKLAENTIVIFTSDNGGLHVPEGPHQKITHNTPYRAGKGYLYEGGIRIPLLVRWPARVKTGQTPDTPVISTDWLPTLLDLTGGKAPDGLDGVSIASVLTGSGKLPDRNLFWHLPHYTNQGSWPSGAVRAGRWKLIEHYGGVLELYDLAADPGENNPVSRPQLICRLQDLLADWRREVGAQGNVMNPDFNPALHRKLYVEVDPSKYDPARATPAEFDRMQGWRKQMNAVVPKRKK
ncbi:MAG TPA: sulfatase [Fimbriiglobus sp.]|jgi:arylsulfatase A-like enzyme|nr:sulfatase [Fimbriiglobus sp.]